MPLRSVIILNRVECLSNRRCVLCFCLLTALTIVGCGGRRIADRFGTEKHRRSNYEIAWVDPQIVISDSLFTLIRAERIDSFYVGRSARKATSITPSIMFQITEAKCITSVNLLSSTGEVIRPLLVRNLSSGYYKLTVELSRFSRETYLDSPLYLKADYCGFSITKPIRQDNEPKW